MEILLNPMVLAIIIMITLCMLRMNAFLAMTAAALICAVLGGATIVEGTSMFLSGMGGNAENALNILMFGVLAEAMSFTKAGEAFTSRMAKLVNGKIWVLCALLFVLGILCETVILIYATFVPVVVPPLMGLLNEYKVDRRKVVTLIIAGLQIGYVCVPIGCGRMFQEIKNLYFLERRIVPRKRDGVFPSRFQYKHFRKNCRNMSQFETHFGKKGGTIRHDIQRIDRGIV